MRRRKRGCLEEKGADLAEGGGGLGLGANNLPHDGGVAWRRREGALLPYNKEKGVE